ncbi:hypothetical protein NDN08_008213 [Rhodosorus marinus]|uniref:3-oxoacyl-[acyl-carrier-protein] synthase n=1 Tax=Rhodosorus marinus TaxID=101924 RepID=A0AAV8UZQ4_9RHOD|nr:hypothetical protein NDN08_008213 [Rhodosorus marinus]
MAAFVVTGGGRDLGGQRRVKNASRIRMSANTRLDGRKRVVITGQGVVSCFGTDPDVFYDSLLEGKSGVRTVQKFDVESWNTKIAAEISPDMINAKEFVTPKLVRRLDPFLLYSIIGGKKALIDAGLEPGSEANEALDKFRCGIICGSGMGGLKVYSAAAEMLNTRDYSRVSPFFIPYAITNMGSGLLAIDLGFMGPNYSVSTACATGNYAINTAAMHIMRGEADLMLAGGVEAAIEPIGLGGFIACRAVSSRNAEPEKASRPWDKGRDGFVMGEGGGLVVLESLEHAKARGANIICEYLGGAHTCDGYHMTEPRPDGMMVSACLTNAMNDAQISPGDVNYINAHATSTPAGDMAEYNAVKKIFAGHTDKVKMNATKSMIGHALGGAGGLEAVATIKAIQRSKLHPTINNDDPEDGLDIDIVPNEAKDHTVNVAISNSFGFGGHNSSVIFGKYND